MLKGNNRYKQIALFIAIIAVALGAISTLTPTLPAFPTPLGYHVTLALTLTYSVLYIGTAALHMSALSGFKPGLRRAYKIVCGGIFLLALSQLQMPLTGIAPDSFWVRGGIVALPFIVANTMLYVGMRAFARLVNVKSVWTSYIFILVLTVGLFLLNFLIERTSPTRTQFILDAAGVLIGWSVLFTGYATIIAWRIKRKLGQAYMSAMKWLVAALCVNTLSGIQFFVLQINDYQDWWSEYGLMMLPSTISGLLFLRAGYAFTQITAEAKVPAAQRASVMDVIVYLATLASNPREIDPILDDMREISATQAAGSTLSQKDELTLAQVCVRLQHYLTTREPLRIFTEQTLHQSIDEKFQSVQTTNPAFWHKVMDENAA